MTTSVLKKQKLSIKLQTAITALTVITAVALPQIFHAMGIISGLGTALGEVFLPMHLPVILAGLIAGPYVGAISGLLAPILSFSITGMPTAAMLPFMVIELCTYGAAAGLLKNVKLPSIVKVLVTQAAGRAVRAIAILIAVYGIGSNKIPVAVIWKSIGVGLFGLALQWTFIPLILYRVEHMAYDKKS